MLDGDTAKAKDLAGFALRCVYVTAVDMHCYTYDEAGKHGILVTRNTYLKTLNTEMGSLSNGLFDT